MEVFPSSSSAYHINVRVEGRADSQAPPPRSSPPSQKDDNGNNDNMNEDDSSTPFSSLNGMPSAPITNMCFTLGLLRVRPLIVLWRKAMRRWRKLSSLRLLLI